MIQSLLLLASLGMQSAGAVQMPIPSVLLNASAAKPVKIAELERIRPEEDFVPATASLLLKELDIEKDEDVRAVDARVFYFRFYARIQFHREVAEFLASGDPADPGFDVPGAIITHMISDPNILVRQNMAQTFQLFGQGMTPEELDRLAHIYFPALISAANDPSPDVSGDVLAALHQLKDARAELFDSAQVQAALRQAAAAASDPDVKSDLESFLK